MRPFFRYRQSKLPVLNLPLWLPEFGESEKQELSESPEAGFARYTKAMASQGHLKKRVRPLLNARNPATKIIYCEAGLVGTVNFASLISPLMASY